ncbi:MAG: diphthamide synthesis protein [Candidatus Nanoarchaeia archaeon]
MDYDLKLEKIVKEVKKSKAKKICLQLPDGLKANADEIVKNLQKKFNKEKLSVEIWLWAGSNFGACDIPFYLSKYNFDLIINFGHLKFGKKFTFKK